MGWVSWLDLFGAAGLGTVIGELLKAVLLAKEVATTFRSKLARLELTLKGIIPRLHKLGRHKKSQMKELLAIIAKGKVLVIKCSKISMLNVFRIVQYSNELGKLDNALETYFNIILPLDHYKETMDTRKEVRQLRNLMLGTIILTVLFAEFEWKIITNYKLFA